MQLKLLELQLNTHLLPKSRRNQYLTCEPAYDVLLLITTLCILPNFPKYSGLFKTCLGD